MNRVTWRLEIMAGWGQRLDPRWLPTNGAETWQRIFEAEDMAGRYFAAGGGGLAWKQIADTASNLAEVLEQYRMQWRCAEDVARGCPAAADAHLATMAVPRGLRPPRRSRTEGPWRVCTLIDAEPNHAAPPPAAVLGDASPPSRATGTDTSQAARPVPATVAEYPSVDLAEGAAVAHRTLAADRAVWAEPVARGPAPTAQVPPGWLPCVDTDLRLTAFAAEDAVSDVTTAAATGHLGPDVLDTALLCVFGEATHHMIREYRTLFRAVWTDLEACPHAAAHDTDAEALLNAAPDEPDRGPGGRWHHVQLAGDRVRVVNRHSSRSAAAASVAAYRAVDGMADGVVRWSEPAFRLR